MNFDGEIFGGYYTSDEFENFEAEEAYNTTAEADFYNAADFDEPMSDNSVVDEAELVGKHFYHAGWECFSCEVICFKDGDKCYIIEKNLNNENKADFKLSVVDLSKPICDDYRDAADRDTFVETIDDIRMFNPECFFECINQADTTILNVFKKEYQQYNSTIDVLLAKLNKYEPSYAIAFNDNYLVNVNEPTNIDFNTNKPYESYCTPIIASRIYVYSKDDPDAKNNTLSAIEFEDEFGNTYIIDEDTINGEVFYTLSVYSKDSFEQYKDLPILDRMFSEGDICEVSTYEYKQLSTAISERELIAKELLKKLNEYEPDYKPYLSPSGLLIDDSVTDPDAAF